MKPANSRARRALLWSLGAAGGLVLVVSFVVWRLVAATPSWWNPAEPQAIESVSRGEYLENQVVTAFHKVRPDNARQWTLELDAVWMNAWLATRLPLWAANRNLSWAHTVEEVNISIDGDRLRLGVRYGSSDSGQAYSVDCRPVLDADGHLSLSDLRLHAGRLPIPLALASESLAGITRSIPELHTILDGGSIEPTVRLSDGRRVRLTHLTMDGDRLVLTLETLPEH